MKRKGIALLVLLASVTVGSILATAGSASTAKVERGSTAAGEQRWVARGGPGRPGYARSVAVSGDGVVGVPESAGSPGDLDHSFGSAGVVRTDFGGSDLANAVAVQPDGKIVAAGTTGTAFALARYNADGSLDTSFGSGGKVTTTIGPRDAANAILLQPDGKIVVAGGSVPLTAPRDPLEPQGFTLARYNEDGSLDPSFGSGGVITTRIDALSVANAAALQPDGKIVAAGVSLPNTGGGRPPFAFALARYEPDGSLDTSFGSGGMVETGCGGADSAALHADGKIVAVGTCEFFPVIMMELVRFNRDGSLDPSFGSNGTVEKGGSVARALAVQPDGGIVLGGSFAKRAGELDRAVPLARYDPDGSLDASFGSGGTVPRPIGFGAPAIALDAAGRIAAAGGYRSAYALARFNADGSLDTRFGPAGIVTKPGDAFGAAAVTVQPDGKIVAAGWYRNDFTLVRYLGSGPRRCVVPKVVGLALARARDRIVSAGCRTGSITWRHSKARKGWVIAQRPTAALHLPAKGKVSLVVSRGRKPR